MNNIHPANFFTKILLKNGLFNISNINSETVKKILGWYAKIFIEEPFRLYEYYTQDTKIQRYQIEHPPIFILGHWRSGTSILQSLLTRDPNRGYLHKYASVFPASFLCSENLLMPPIKFITNCFELKKNISEISVSWEWDTPGELDIAMTTLFSSYSPHWGHVFPNNEFNYYMDKYLFFDTATRREENKWKEICLSLLKKVSIKNNHRQLIIKSPGNTARVKQLLDLFPKAKFVYIHRNPFDVFYSNKKMWHIIIENLSFQQISESQIRNIILKTYKRVIENYLDTRTLIPGGNLVELRYEELINKPMYNLAQIYKRLSLPGFDYAKSYFQEFISNHIEDNRSKYNYETNTVADIEQYWELSLQKWPYRNPVVTVAAE